MLRNLGNTVKQCFSTELRYFAVTTDRVLNAQSLMDQGLVLFGAKREQSYYYVFHCKDEHIPFDVAKEQECKQINIVELELHTKGQTKQIAQLLKFR